MENTEPDPESPDRENHDAMVRHRRRVAHARSPEEQAAISLALQTQAMNAIASDPDAYRAFMERNHRKRSIDKMRELETEMMRRRSES